MTARTGIRLLPFDIDNADLILSWRNDPAVRANSLNDNEIDRQAHLVFLERLKARAGVFYYVVAIDEVPQAALNIDVSNPEATWGCYLAPSAAPRPGLFPLLILITGYLAFDRHGATALRSDVLAHNAAPQRMNNFLGVPEVGRRMLLRDEACEIQVIEYRLPRSDFANLRSRAAKVLSRRNRELFEAFTR